MAIYSVPRTYTEDKVKYVFRDVIDDDGVRKIQHLVKEPWGEEFWNDNDPPDSDLISAARAYDQTQREMERVTEKKTKKKAP